MSAAGVSILPSATFSDSINGAYTLSPQTTAFAPTGTQTAACNSRSLFCFTTAGQLAKGYACDLVDRIDANNLQYLNSECYPPHYDLVNNGDPLFDRTLAYPGTACPAGFTPACTTTLTLTNPSAKPQPFTGTLTQTWCCPRPTGLLNGNNNWVCTDRDQLDPTSRLCLSLVGTTTNLWFSASASMSGSAAYTTSTVGPEMSIRIMRAAFPLGEVQQDVLNGLAGLSVAAQTTAQTTAVTTTTALQSGATAKPGVSSDGGTNPGIIAGIVVGCLALLGFIGVGVYLCVRFRREGKEEELKRRMGTDKGEEQLVEAGGAEVPEHRWDLKAKDEDAGAAVTELPAGWSQPGRFVEMGADTGAVELPTGYNDDRGGIK
ncbi:hypothetical protein OQA88_7076 [Cercophora sp. LCS_1]